MSDIIEYIEITNTSTGTYDGAGDVLVLEEYNPNIPVINPPYVAENTANKRYDLLNPNNITYPSTLAVSTAISGITTAIIILTGTTLPNYYYTKVEINTYTGLTNTRLNLVDDNINYLSGVTNTKLNIENFNAYSGGTNIKLNIINNNINYLSGVTNTKLNNEDFNYYTGDTKINLDIINNNINYLSGVTDTKLFITDFNDYTGATDIILQNIQSNVDYLSGVTDIKLFIDDFNYYTGTTAPTTFANKLNALTGATNGLTNNNRVIGLGGSLSTNTLIQGGYCFNIDAVRGFNIRTSGNTDINIDAQQCGGFLIKSQCGVIDTFPEFTNSVGILGHITEPAGFAIYDNRTGISQTGIVYANDYSLNYVDRSLVDKRYVDTIATGLQVHNAVSIGTTTSVPLSGLTTIDGISTTIGMRILVKNQIDETQNGIYDASGGVWSRASDFDFSPLGEITNGDMIPITSGSTQNNTVWILTTPNPIISGVTDLTFTRFSSVIDITGGQGIDISQIGGVHTACVELASNCGLTFCGNGLAINPNIGGNGLCYNSGVINVNATSCSSVPAIPVGYNSGDCLIIACCDIINTFSVNNGLTKSGNNIYLGGSLTGNTSISGAHTFGFNNTIINLTGGSGINLCGPIKLLSTPITGTTNDNVLVWNNSDKCIKSISGAAFGLVTGATNGLNVISKKISLGGTLNNNTNINLGAYILKITGNTTCLSCLYTPTIIGGMLTGTTLSLIGTSANGTLTNKAISLLVGNNGGTEAVTVLNNGNLGIGTTNPTYKLHVTGNTYSACIYSPLFSGTTFCASGNITTNTGTISASKVYASTCVCSPLITGSTLCSKGNSNSCISYASSCICSPTITGTSLNISSTATVSKLYATSCVCSPLITGGTVCASGNICGTTIYGTSCICSPLFSGTTLRGNTICSTSLCGVGNRLVQANTGGTLSASAGVVEGKLSNSTIINLLINDANWDVNGEYFGTVITGTSQGQYYKTYYYYYSAYSDNDWFRIKLNLPQIISGEITGATTINLLGNNSNWTVDGIYTGSTITNTYGGQYYRNNDYYYAMFNNTEPIRLLRG